MHTAIQSLEQRLFEEVRLTGAFSHKTLRQNAIKHSGMQTKSPKDLEKVIVNFEHFVTCISKLKDIIGTGKLAEFYCARLFNLELVRPRNANFDARSSDGRKFEIKHRTYTGKTPPSMRINLKGIDFVIFVELDKDSLLPKRILQIRSEDMTLTEKGRVSFRKALDENRAVVLYQS